MLLLEELYLVAELYLDLYFVPSCSVNKYTYDRVYRQTDINSLFIFLLCV